MTDRTVRLHRVLRAKPEKVYRAFLDAGALAKWLPPYGFTCTVHHLEARTGGTFRMSFHNFSSGNGHSFGASTSSWFRTSGSATRTNSTIRTCRA